MADRSLSFNVAAIDKTAKSFEKIALRLERLEGKLDKLDRKKAEVDVAVNTSAADRALTRLDGQSVEVEAEVNVDRNRALRALMAIARMGAAVGGGFARSFGAAIRMGLRDPKIFLAVVAVLAASMPFAGALAATLFVGAFGAGLATLGIVAAAQSKKVQKEFVDLKDHVATTMADIASPFEDTLRNVATIARDVFDELAPTLEGVFATLAPGVTTFARDLGDALEALEPALGPMSDAFTALTDALGPHLVQFAQDLADELVKLADVVNDNADLFAAFLGVILSLGVVAVRIIRGLAEAFVWMSNAVREINKGATAGLLAIVRVARDVNDVILRVIGNIIHGLAEAFGNVPIIGPKLKAAAKGFDDFAERARDGFDKAVQKAKEWNQTAKRIDRIIELKADIRNLEQNLAQAKRKLKDPTLSKPQRKLIKGDIRDLERKLGIAKRKLAAIHPPTVKRIRGNIRHLSARLAVAKRKIQDPTISKPTRKRLRGHIADLQRKIRRARRLLRSVKDKTVTLTINQHYGRPTGFIGPIAPTGRAVGGPVERNRSYLVGERGPELFTPGSSGHITPNHELGGDVKVTVLLDGQAIEPRMVRVLTERDRDTKARTRAGVGGAR